jgi:hypothetical protein
VIFEAVTLAGWLTVPLFPSLNVHEEGLISAILNSEAWLFYSTSMLAPVFVVFMMFSWAPRLLFSLRRLMLKRPQKSSQLTLKVGTGRLSANSVLAHVNSVLDMVFKPDGAHSKRYWLVLTLSVVVAFSVAVYPILPGVNPSGKIIGADTSVYATWLTDMDGHGSLLGVFQYVFFSFSDRSLSLFLMYLTWKASTISALQAMLLLPMLLAPLLVLATFFFTRGAGFNFRAASLASLFTAFSFHITAGMFGGFLSNWIGLIFLYLSFGFFFQSLKKRSWNLLGATVALQVALMLSHVYTWMMLVGALALFLAVTSISWLKKRGDSSEVKIASAALAANILAYAVRNLALGVALMPSDAAAVSQETMSLSFLQSFWWILNRSITEYLGISLMNPLLFFLAFLGAFAVALNARTVNRFLLAFLAASIVPFMFGDWVMQTRILYNLPIQIFSLLGCFMVIRLVQNSFNESESKKLCTLLFVLIILTDLNFALRCSFNLAS